MIVAIRSELTAADAPRSGKDSRNFGLTRVNIPKTSLTSAYTRAVPEISARVPCAVERRRREGSDRQVHGVPCL